MTNFPLQGLRVLDFGQGVAGPYCAQLLGDHGADVIKIEPPRGDWCRTLGAQAASGFTGAFISVNRNKRALCLDLKHAEAVRIARILALKADVVLESFRPGVMERLGLGYEALRKENPKLVYCDVTGFGASGPNIDLPATDSTMQAYGGLMSINGELDGEPLRVGNVVSDMLAGMNAFSGVLLALLSRGASGVGRRTSVSLLDSIVAFQAPTISEYLVTGKAPRRVGNQHPLSAAAGVYRTSNGAISFTVMERKWTRFCSGLALDRLIDDPRFSTGGARQNNRDALREVLVPMFLAKSTEEWLAILRGMDLNCAPINAYPALLEDPQVVHNGLLQSISHAGEPNLPTLRNPVRLEDEPARLARPPRKGEHSNDILARELGFSAGEIEALNASGAAYQADGATS
jgi:crotonobetainyl-CoA:carnitine CoA-transferase CaiB-like acyl-CoA transferase